MKHSLLKFAVLLLIAPAWSMEPAPAGTSATAPAVAAPAASAKPVKKPAAAQAQSAGLEPAVQTTPGTAPRRAQDRLELDTTQITGNRELPRVLYVVPWKHSDLGDLAGRPANSLLDEVLAPVDRDVFRRQNRYYEALKPDSTGAGAASGTEVEK
jgi:hypothetical protein